MKKILSVLVLGLFLFSNCGGRAANPIAVSQYGDREMSCRAVEHELSFIEQEIQRLMPKTDKTGKNVALGIAGWFLIVPWFFMDFKKSEQIEIDALRRRYNHLVIIAADKNCGFEKEQIPTFKQKKEHIETPIEAK